jgi:hypothetical protein
MKFVSNDSPFAKITHWIEIKTAWRLSIIPVTVLAAPEITSTAHCHQNSHHWTIVPAHERSARVTVSPGTDKSRRDRFNDGRSEKKHLILQRTYGRPTTAGRALDFVDMRTIRTGDQT